MSIKQYLLVPIMVLGLTACGSGGSGDSSVQQNDDSGSSLSQPLSIDVGEKVLNSDGTLKVGLMTVSDVRSAPVVQLGGLLLVSGAINHVLVDLASGDARFYEVENIQTPQVAAHSGSGSIGKSTNNSIWGGTLDGSTTITFEDEASKDIMLADQTSSLLFPSSHSISSLSATYVQGFGVPLVNISLTIDNNGELTGSTDSGCIFNGTVTLPVSSNNAYYVQSDVTQCEEAGDYVGIGYLEDKNDLSYLNLHLFSDNHAMNYRMKKTRANGAIFVSSTPYIYKATLIRDQDQYAYSAVKVSDTIMINGDIVGEYPRQMTIDLETGEIFHYQADTSGNYISQSVGSGKARIDTDEYGLISGELFLGEAKFADLKELSVTGVLENDYEPTIASIADVYSSSVIRAADLRAYINVAVTIDNSGTLTGSSSFGCVYGGEVSQPVPNKNVFSVELDISNCDIDGAYSGLLYMSGDGTGVRKNLTLQVSNNDTSVLLVLVK